MSEYRLGDRVGECHIDHALVKRPASQCHRKLRELYQIVGVIYGSQPMKGSADANGKIAMQARALAGAAGAVVNLTSQSCSSCGSRSVGTVTAATSFVINSMNAADVSKVYWEIKCSN